MVSKNMLVKLHHFPQGSVWKYKSFDWNHHPNIFDSTYNDRDGALEML